MGWQSLKYRQTETIRNGAKEQWGEDEQHGGI